MKNSTTVIVADSQMLCRVGLCQVLKEADGVDIVAEAENTEQLLQKVTHHKSDVVVVDYNQPKYFDESIIAAIREKSPKTEVLVISSDDRKDRIFGVLEQGVNSFLTKQCDAKEIVDAIAATARGEKFYCHKILDLLVKRSFPKKSEGGPNKLTPREIQILKMVAQGKVAKEIAAELSISPHTIYTHRKNILSKLNLTSPMEMVVYAFEQGIIELERD
ncbi:MAG: response regulator transcription factor [Saprospiraceae bacterium]|nr:response regulator transcription factor [Saprospiraceae bacterium]